MSGTRIARRGFEAIRACVVLSILCFVGASASDASDACDARAIQAVATMYLTQQHVRQPGIFNGYELVVDGRFAWASGGLGTLGYGSEAFAFARTREGWTVLLKGGGVIGASELASVGIPDAVAKSIVASSCYGRRAEDLVAHRRGERVIRSQMSTARARAVRRRGPAAIPPEPVRMMVHGRPIVVDVFQPIGTTLACFEAAPR